MSVLLPCPDRSCLVLNIPDVLSDTFLSNIRTSNIVYTSEFNKWYLSNVLNITPSKIFPCKFDQIYSIKNIAGNSSYNLCGIHANFGPGSAIYIWKDDSGFTIYVGKFRFGPEIILNQVLKSFLELKKRLVVQLVEPDNAIACIYATNDRITTGCVVSLLRRELKKKPEHIVLGTPRLGFEKLLKQIATELCVTLHVDNERYQTVSHLRMESVFCQKFSPGQIEVKDLNSFWFNVEAKKVYYSPKCKYKNSVYIKIGSLLDEYSMEGMLVDEKNIVYFLPNINKVIESDIVRLFEVLKPSEILGVPHGLRNVDVFKVQNYMQVGGCPQMIKPNQTNRILSKTMLKCYKTNPTALPKDLLEIFSHAPRMKSNSNGISKCESESFLDSSNSELSSMDVGDDSGEEESTNVGQDSNLSCSPQKLSNNSPKLLNCGTSSKTYLKVLNSRFKPDGQGRSDVQSKLTMSNVAKNKVSSADQDKFMQKYLASQSDSLETVNWEPTARIANVKGNMLCSEHPLNKSLVSKATTESQQNARESSMRVRLEKINKPLPVDEAQKICLESPSKLVNNTISDRKIFVSLQKLDGHPRIVNRISSCGTKFVNQGTAVSKEHHMSCDDNRVIARNKLLNSMKLNYDNAVAAKPNLRLKRIIDPSLQDQSLSKISVNSSPLKFTVLSKLTLKSRTPEVTKFLTSGSPTVDSVIRLCSQISCDESDKEKSDDCRLTSQNKGLGSRNRIANKKIDSKPGTEASPKLAEQRARKELQNLLISGTPNLCPVNCKPPESDVFKMTNGKADNHVRKENRNKWENVQTIKISETKYSRELKMLLINGTTNLCPVNCESDTTHRSLSSRNGKTESHGGKTVANASVSEKRHFKELNGIVTAPDVPSQKIFSGDVYEIENKLRNESVTSESDFSENNHTHSKGLKSPLFTEGTSPHKSSNKKTHSRSIKMASPTLFEDEPKFVKRKLENTSMDSNSTNHRKRRRKSLSESSHESSVVEVHNGESKLTDQELKVLPINGLSKLCPTDPSVTKRARRLLKLPVSCPSNESAENSSAGIKNVEFECSESQKTATIRIQRTEDVEFKPRGGKPSVTEKVGATQTRKFSITKSTQNLKELISNEFKNVLTRKTQEQFDESKFVKRKLENNGESKLKKRSSEVDSKSRIPEQLILTNHKYSMRSVKLNKNVCSIHNYSNEGQKTLNRIRFMKMRVDESSKNWRVMIVKKKEDNPDNSASTPTSIVESNSEIEKTTESKTFSNIVSAENTPTKSYRSHLPAVLTDFQSPSLDNLPLNDSKLLDKNKSKHSNLSNKSIRGLSELKNLVIDDTSKVCINSSSESTQKGGNISNSLSSIKAKELIEMKKSRVQNELKKLAIDGTPNLCPVNTCANSVSTKSPETGNHSVNNIQINCSKSFDSDTSKDSISSKKSVKGSSELKNLIIDGTPNLCPINSSSKSTQNGSGLSSLNSIKAKEFMQIKSRVQHIKLSVDKSSKNWRVMIVKKKEDKPVSTATTIEESNSEIEKTTESKTFSNIVSAENTPTKSCRSHLPAVFTDFQSPSLDNLPLNDSELLDKNKSKKSNKSVRGLSELKNSEIHHTSNVHINSSSESTQKVGNVPNSLNSIKAKELIEMKKSRVQNELKKLVIHGTPNLCPVNTCPSSVSAKSPETGNHSVNYIQINCPKSFESDKSKDPISSKKNIKGSSELKNLIIDGTPNLCPINSSSKSTQNDNVPNSLNSIKANELIEMKKSRVQNELKKLAIDGTPNLCPVNTCANNVSSKSPETGNHSVNNIEINSIEPKRLKTNHRSDYSSLDSCLARNEAAGKLEPNRLREGIKKDSSCSNARTKCSYDPVAVPVDEYFNCSFSSNSCSKSENDSELHFWDDLIGIDVSELESLRTRSQKALNHSVVEAKSPISSRTSGIACKSPVHIRNKTLVGSHFLSKEIKEDLIDGMRLNLSMKYQNYDSNKNMVKSTLDHSPKSPNKRNSPTKPPDSPSKLPFKSVSKESIVESLSPRKTLLKSPNRKKSPFKELKSLKVNLVNDPCLQARSVLLLKASNLKCTPKLPSTVTSKSILKPNGVHAQTAKRTSPFKTCKMLVNCLMENTDHDCNLNVSRANGFHSKPNYSYLSKTSKFIKACSKKQRKEMMGVEIPKNVHIKPCSVRVEDIEKKLNFCRSLGLQMISLIPKKTESSVKKFSNLSFYKFPKRFKRMKRKPVRF